MVATIPLILRLCSGQALGGAPTDCCASTSGWRLISPAFQGAPFVGEAPELLRTPNCRNSATFAITIGLLVAKRQPELLEVDWSKGGSLDVLW
jgi:hypothetical protein